jgi:FAD/FMN-containing dehydrogenase
MRRIKFWIIGIAVLIGLIVLPPALFIAKVWLHDGRAPLPQIPAGTDDASRLNANTPHEVVPVARDPDEAERQLVALLQRAANKDLRIAISGAHHSMGGHTIYPDGIVLDMLPFNAMSLNKATQVLTVGSGARWSQVIPYLDEHGLAVAIMQSNNDFSVGGSISVNCHGWQHNAAPIGSSVESFRIMTADGDTHRCNRTENSELFALALGGYGLFGIILEVDLRVVHNEFYTAEAHPVNAADYDRVYHELTRDNTYIGMAYGRINVAPGTFLQEGNITLLKRHDDEGQARQTLRARKPKLLNRLVFRGGMGSNYGKKLRWRLEKHVGESGGETLSRNQIMNEPVHVYATRDPNATDILHEYFVPVARLNDFLETTRPIFLKHQPELMNITVRNVKTDSDTVLRYAPEAMFGLVMLFQQMREGADAEAAMQTLTRDLIDAALACGGRYYLPYRLHATQEQFLKAYPQAPDFFARKRHYDPDERFANQFYLKYGTPTASESHPQPSATP